MKTSLPPVLLALILFIICSCEHKAQTNPKQDAVMHATPVEVPVTNNEARAYFASGCFWCVEPIYESVIGVKEVISGYSGGHTENPSYEDSNTGQTGHAETIEVIYNPNIVDFATLVDVYFGSQDPTQVNGQGPDRGSQYRSIIFYQNDLQRSIAEAKKAVLSKKLGKPVAAEIYPFQKFWKAEDYHQDYKKRNPNNPYIKNISNPRYDKFKTQFHEILKDSAN
ncbi:peptide-methionine (S)-S-oxide reductase MsrA [Formosa sp. S-31]|uniref:peptide-methionine (S)-S-oxide reductase MsrA n=1 Tax=Formosa sp. S-31 TaxID=2790949 RepID=UPI003EBE2059